MLLALLYSLFRLLLDLLVVRCRSEASLHSENCLSTSLQWPQCVVMPSPNELIDGDRIGTEVSR